MQKSVLVEIVRSLSRKEIREVQKWLQSPAHNQRQDVVQLFDHLVKNLAQEKEVEKETAWSAIFPAQAYDDAYMRQVMYFLLKSLESYLVFAEISKNSVHAQSILLKVYRNRQLERSFRLTIETARKQQINSPFRNSSFLQEKYLLEKEQHYYLVGQKWSMEINLQETSTAFDLAYIADKLRVSCSMLSHQAIYKKVYYDMGTLLPIISYVETSGLLKEPAISLYYYAFKAQTEPENESYFLELEKILFEKEHLFPVEEVREFYLLAINYCISRINVGIDSYLHRAFNFYKSGFEKGILLENGIISKMSFGNAVSNALKIREFSWAEGFVQKFKDKLEEKNRESMTNFNMARIYFEKGEYGKAQQLLSKFEYDDIVLNLIAKTMLLKIYYEASEYDTFESLLESMRTYLQRKDAISPNHRIVYKNLLGVMRRLIHLNPYSKSQVEKFRELVTTTNPLIERDWLLRQISDK